MATKDHEIDSSIDEEFIEVQEIYCPDEPSGEMVSHSESNSGIYSSNSVHRNDISKQHEEFKQDK